MWLLLHPTSGLSVCEPARLNSSARWCQPLTIDVMFAALCFPRYSYDYHGEAGACANDYPAIGCGIYLNSQGLTLEDTTILTVT
jgi:hypothetical protein